MLNLINTPTLHSMLLLSLPLMPYFPDYKKKKSDGIIQVSTGGGEFASGLSIKDMAVGAIGLAEYIHYIADKYEITVALHTDHCHPNKVENFLKPLLEYSKKRVSTGKLPLFSSHMFDGSELPLHENMDIACELLKEYSKINVILEVEAGVVGGEEDGHDTSSLPAEKLYTTPEDMVEVYRRLAEIKNGRFMFAATFGNVHGVYKPGNVKLKPTILKEGQAAIAKKFGAEVSFDLVFHGGSGSSIAEIHETLEYGVVKMNIDTDTQYAFTQPIVNHIFNHYDKVLKIDGEMGDKKYYDPRAYLKKAEIGMKERVMQACDDLRSTNKSISL